MERIQFSKSKGFMSREWDYEKIEETLHNDKHLKIAWCEHLGISMDDVRVSNWAYEFQIFHDGYIAGRDFKLLTKSDTTPVEKARNLAGE